MRFAERREAILDRIALHAHGKAELIAVSKMVEAKRLLEALQAGHHVFAENYVQEAKAKWPALRARYPDLRLHLIGHLQSNKAEDAVALFDRIDTLDRPKLAATLAGAMRKLNKTIPLLIEVNIGREPQKHGCMPEDVAALLQLARGDYGLKVEGLMCIPPAAQDPKPFFTACAALARQHQLATLSMGMSADYVPALQAGASEIRIGSALFGARPA